MITILKGKLVKDPEFKDVGETKFATFTVVSKRYDYTAKPKPKNVFEEFKVTTTGYAAQALMDSQAAEGDEVVCQCELKLTKGGGFSLYATKVVALNGEVGFNLHIVCGAVESGTHTIVERDEGDDGEVVNGRIRIPYVSRGGEQYNRFFKVVGWDGRARGMKHLLPKDKDSEEDRRWAMFSGETSVRKYTDKDGEDRTSTEISVDKMEFLDTLTPKFEWASAEEGGEEMSEEEALAMANAQDHDDDDLPF